MNKMIFKLFIAVVCGFLVISCAATGPKHYETGETKFRELPFNLANNIQVFYPPGFGPPSAPSAGQETKAGQQGEISKTADPLVLNPLTKKEKDQLDEAVQRHMNGTEIITSVKAHWPDPNVPKNHRAYQMDNYLRRRGIPVNVEPLNDPRGTLWDVSLGVR